MPRIEAQVVVPVPVDVAYAVSQTHGAVRHRWDPFIHEQHFLDGATEPAKGVRTFTRQRFGPSMTSQYVSYVPPAHVGMTMVEGPWFFAVFGGGWRFTAIDERSTRAVWRYTFTCRPRLIQPVAHPVGRWLLGREIRRRIAGYARGCTDEQVLAAAYAQIGRIAGREPVDPLD